MIKSTFRFILFVGYTSLLFILPLSILWGRTGFAVGLAFWAFFMSGLAYRAPLRILRRLKARRLTRAEAPYLFHVTEELCRRSEIPVPGLWVTPSKVPNSLATGFFARGSHLLVTSEVLYLTRTQQIALIGRSLMPIVLRSTFNTTFLSQFLHFIETCASWSYNLTPSQKDSEPIGHFILQTILYPFSMIPIYLLGRSKDPKELDRLSILISKEPLALSEVYRKIEALLHTQLFTVPLSTAPLFLAEPKPKDVLTAVLFKRRSLADQVRNLNPLVTGTTAS